VKVFISSFLADKRYKKKKENSQVEIKEKQIAPAVLLEKLNFG